MKKYFLFVFVLTLLALSTLTFAQSTNWADYGLSEDAVKFLSAKEKQDILNSRTPAQTIQKQKEEIEKTGSSSLLFVPGSILPGKTPDAPLSSEIVNCFDYYTFGSIDADMTSQSSSAVSGMTMNFFGNIKNKNKYPVVAGTLYVKIFRNVGGEKNANGPDVVDQFIAVDNVTLPANDSVPVKFSWKVPAYALDGKYQLVTYFTSDKKFNLLGLSFTDDIVGNSFNFTVSGEKTGVSFDKSSVIINNNPYYFAAYPPRIQGTDEANISIKVDNTTNQAQSIKTNWKLYRWDGINPSNLIREFSTTTAIKANSLGDIKFSIPEKSEPVYYLVGEFTYKDAKSVVGIRFVRDGVDRVRLNFPAVTAYPLKKGEPVTLFSCLHNSGQSSQVPNNKIVLEVTDESGKVIESYTYNGIVTGDMIAVKKDFVSKVDLDIFSVRASLYNNGNLVDESIMKYDCKLIDPTKCSPEKDNLWNILALAGGVLALIVIIVVVIITKRKKLPVAPILMLMLGFCLFSPYAVEAKSVPWNILENKTFVYFWNNSSGATTASNGSFGSASAWGKGLVNPNITIKYNTEIRDVDTNTLITDGDFVSVGSRLILKFLPHQSEDIYWFGTGYSTDSPYGDWIAGMAPPTKACLEKDFNGSTAWRAEKVVNIYIPLVVAPPIKTISGLDNLSCEALVGDEGTGYSMNCIVTSAGSIKPQFSFGNTTGKFYYRYSGKNDAGHNACYANQIPMENDVLTDYHTTSYLNGNQDTYGHTSSPYTLQVPTQIISYNINATTTQGVENLNKLITNNFNVSCIANAVAKGADVLFSAVSSNASGTVSYLWNDNTSRNTKLISGGYSVNGLHPGVSFGDVPVFVKGTDDSGSTSMASCTVTVGCFPEPSTQCVNGLKPTYTCLGTNWVRGVDEVCPIIDDASGVSSSCELDGVSVANGMTQVFYKNRISNSCVGKTFICKINKLIDVASGPSVETDIYKYRTCVTPVPSEF